MRSPILGGSYTLRSPNAAASRMVNLFPEAIPDGGKEAGYLSRCPGLALLATAGTGPVRGMWSFGGVGYVVSGSSLYKITTAWVATLIGSVSGTGPVSMADNGTQLFIACNPGGYIYNASTAVLAEITAPAFPGAVNVGYLDGFFVFTEPNSQKFWVTSLLDGTKVDPLDFASAEGAPDNIVAMHISHREVWLFGTNSTEIWYNAGLADFPIARIQGAFIEAGCVSPYSVAKLDNSLFWIGSDARGAGIVYRANGYVPARISTHAIEYALQSYTTISDAIGYSYQQEGHSFYVLTFPTAGATWVFDAATNLWHERAGFVNGSFTRHRSNCQMNFGGEIVVGDYENGNIYSLSIGVFSDNGAIQKILRSWRAIPPSQNDLKRSFHHALQLDCESGVGLDGTQQGTDPVISLRWSDDGGHTWSNYHDVALGKMGKFGQRVIWRRLGMTGQLRDRVYEVSMTDPAGMTIMGAKLLSNKGAS